MQFLLLFFILDQTHYFQKRHQPAFLFVREGGALRSMGKELLHTVNTGFCWSLFLLFPRVQKQTCLSILSLDINVVSIPEQRWCLERILVIFALSFCTLMSLTQFKWSEHSGPVIFVLSTCTRSPSLQGPTPMKTWNASLLEMLNNWSQIPKSYNAM